MALCRPCETFERSFSDTPHGIECRGLQARRKVKEAANIPTIMMSANLPLREARQRKIMCLKKPVELDELLQTIEQFLT